MPRILKFPLPIAGPQTIRSGYFYKVLSVGWQGDQLCLWAEAIPGDDELMKIYVALTGETGVDGDFIGTAIRTTGIPELPYYVVHVYRQS